MMPFELACSLVREYLAPGEQPGEVFDTKWGKAGFLICTCYPTPP